MRAGNPRDDVRGKESVQCLVGTGVDIIDNRAVTLTDPHDAPR